MVEARRHPCRAVRSAPPRNHRWRCPSGRESGSAPLGSSIGAHREAKSSTKSDVLSAFADAVTHARAPHRDCTDAGHDLALGQMPVAHQSPAAIIGQLVGMGLSQAATSASTACPNSVLAPLRKTSVSGSENCPCWVSSKTLVSVTAYHSFGGEVEALNTPTIRRLTPSCRHQLSALAPT